MATYDLTSSTPSSIAVGDIINCPYSGDYKTLTLPAGHYKLECWGAQGGGRQNDSSIDSAQGGLGGYSIGVLNLTNSTTIYLYTGGMGSSSSTGLASGGWNGGGSAYASSSSEPANGGGGASDIRINSTSLYARVIVAGGGGGAGEDSGDSPGYGGGTTGGTSSGHSTPATQTSTGTGGVFGIGASTPNDGGAGGGGWYGGGTTNGSQTIPTANSSSDTSGGCGGSGYVFTEKTTVPSGYLLSSTYQLNSANTIIGSKSFKSPSGTSERGHAGNGYIRITVIEDSSLNEEKYETLEYSFTGSVQTVTLPAGNYMLECWGAYGIYSNASPNNSHSYGYGGYASGKLTLKSATTLYIYVGGKPTATISESYYLGGWNGGGGSCKASCNDNGAGGGATDICLVSSDVTLDSYGRYIRSNASYLSRIIVAGGGGGGRSNNAVSQGGYCPAVTTSLGYNASMTSAGNIGANAVIGDFGYGASSTSTSDDRGAGGGGWYGGGSNGDSYGGGGSSFVWSSNHASYIPSGYTPDTSYQMTDINTDAGTGSDNDNDSLNGYARITILDSKKKRVKLKMNNNYSEGSLYVKVSGSWQEMSKGYVKIGGAWKELV